MFQTIYNAHTRRHDLIEVDEGTGVTTRTGTALGKDEREYELLRLNHGDVYRLALAVFGEREFLSTRRFLRAAQMIADGNLPVDTGNGDWLVRSQSQEDEGRVYRVVSQPSFECACDDYLAGRTLPAIPLLQAHGCKHIAAVALTLMLA